MNISQRIFSLNRRYIDILNESIESENTEDYKLKKMQFEKDCEDLKRNLPDVVWKSFEEGLNSLKSLVRKPPTSLTVHKNTTKIISEDTNFYELIVEKDATLEITYGIKVNIIDAGTCIINGTLNCNGDFLCRGELKVNL